MTMMDAAGMAALQGSTPVGLNPSAMSGRAQEKQPRQRNLAPKMTGQTSPTHSNRSRARQIAMNKALTGDTGGGSY